MQPPFPEIFNMSLNWTIDPKPTSILKSLVSIPQMFDLKDMMNSNAQKSQQYVFRGMICFSDGGHYLAFFRRMIIKMGYLVEA